MGRRASRPALGVLAALLVVTGACRGSTPAGAGSVGLTDDDILVLVTYPVLAESRLGEPVPAEVDGAVAALRDDRETHEGAWRLWTDIAPEPWESSVRKLRMVTDGPEGDLAGVERIDGDRWILELDAADLTVREELEHTLVHELAHLISLAPGQIAPETAPHETIQDAHARCAPSVGIEEGCLAEGSYLGAFIERFWADDDLAAADEIAWSDDPDALTEQRYDAEPDRWVSDYAASHPEEDFAESWTAYVLYDWETEDAALQWVAKAAFFEAYPELRAVRDEILAVLDLG